MPTMFYGSGGSAMTSDTTWGCRICPAQHPTREARAACEKRDIAERAWLAK